MFINEKMYSNANEKIQSKITEANTWEEFMGNLNKKGVVRTWWCQDKECENTVKNRSKNETIEIQGEALLSGSAKTLCMPYE